VGWAFFGGLFDGGQFEWLRRARSWFVGFVGFVRSGGFVGFVGFVGIVGFAGLVGFVGFVGFVGRCNDLKFAGFSIRDKDQVQCWVQLTVALGLRTVAIQSLG
jgi:hypothetical protein